jgi:hypothetical protein
MTKQFKNQFVPLNKEVLQTLTAEVKETLATDFATPEKVFSAADLWNIQRNKKRNPGRRFLV